MGQHFHTFPVQLAAKIEPLFGDRLWLFRAAGCWLLAKRALWAMSINWFANLVGQSADFSFQPRIRTLGLSDPSPSPSPESLGSRAKQKWQLTDRQIENAVRCADPGLLAWPTTTGTTTTAANYQQQLWQLTEIVPRTGQKSAMAAWHESK